MIFQKHVKDKKFKLHKQIYKEIQIRNLPHYIFDRQDTVDGIRQKLFSNLEIAADLVLTESERIIKRYKKLDFYIEELAFGKKREM